MTFKEFKAWLKRENETAADIKSDCIKKGACDVANFWIGYAKATEHISKIFDSVEQEETQNEPHKEFSWGDVEIGDSAKFIMESD